MHEFGWQLLAMIVANPLPTGAIVGSSLLTLLAFTFPMYGVD
ncbi:hypothetical protein [Rhodoplanes roseus]|nr:hypothetical protein [Rhodoplanes roseus]